jgi:hypothetical protein
MAFDDLEDSVSPLTYELIRSSGKFFDFNIEQDFRLTFKMRIASFTPCTTRYSIDGTE